MTSRPSTAAPILAVLAIMLVTLGAYVGGYFWLGEYIDVLLVERNERYAIRRFPYCWEQAVFAPMGQVEAWILKDEVRFSLDNVIRLPED